MLSTAQNVQPGATERSCPDGVAFWASSLRIALTVWFWTEYHTSEPLTVKASRLPFLSTAGDRNSGMPQRAVGHGLTTSCSKPTSLPEASSPAFTLW
jgi:hypothetical protein